MKTVKIGAELFSLREQDGNIFERQEAEEYD